MSISVGANEAPAPTIETLYQFRARQRPKLAKSPIAETSNENHATVISERDRALAYFEGGIINVWVQGALECLLACPPAIAVRESIHFTGRPDGWDDGSEGRWVASAIAQVVAAGILPAPSCELPTFRSRVETIGLANRQNPRNRCAVGSVDWITWSQGKWRVSVRFDAPPELKRGGQLVNFSNAAIDGSNHRERRATLLKHDARRN